jgi:monoamine oxidase
VRGLMTGDLDDVSLLHLLTLVRGHGSIGTLFSIENGAQENMVDGGAGVIAERMAARLGDAVRLGVPVRTIDRRPDRVVVQGDGLDVTAPHVVVTVPPELILGIAFDPPLPTDRRTLYENAVAGPETKTLVVYDAPFWRDDGFSGQSAEPGSASEVTIDATARRGAVLAALAARFGPRAGAPAAYVDTAWWTEEWTRGCSFAHLRPGILSRYGPLLREPWGRVHWAGTETATVSHGAIDGAVRSGERAASEILGLAEVGLR